MPADLKSPLVYLKEELDTGQFYPEWKALDMATKKWYREAACEEMDVLNITHS